MRAAHRYMTKFVFTKEWKLKADLSNENGWLDIRSRSLYAGMRILSLAERHRILRNNFILKSQESSNN